jgi:pSer/pThr/pTyr-binding forkhead associated (FHA) protein
MSELIVKYPDRAPVIFPWVVYITIGRSARNDLCIPDPFASVHAEVRRGGEYVLQDLGSANGTSTAARCSGVIH